MDTQRAKDKIDEEFAAYQKRENDIAERIKQRDMLYRATISIIQDEIEKLLLENYRRIVEMVKKNGTTKTYYLQLKDEERVNLLVRASKKGADEFFKKYEPDFLRSSQENSQENGLHILLQLPKNMQ